MAQAKFILAEHVQSQGAPGGKAAGDSVRVPAALRPYMGGKEILVPRR